MKTAIVTTTIYVPRLLASYADDAKKHGHNPIFIVVADKKTPPEAEAFCAELAKTSGFRVEYFTVERQDEYLSRFPALKAHLPWNCIQRRNVGLLYAFEEGCETIITIDDDNFRVTEDYIGAHVVSGERECDVISTTTGWLNVCTTLKEKHGRTFYHRGFPLEKRHLEENWKTQTQTVRPVVNAGLWLGDPDVDAMERLYWSNEPTEATEYTSTQNYAPSKGIWTPFNSQNTAIARRAIPAYFLSPMVGRYDDIWAAYIIKRIADHLGESIVFGEPIVRQERNPHNYWKDLDNERYGHALTLRFTQVLDSIDLEGKDYGECYAELVDSLPTTFTSLGKLSDVEDAFVAGYFEGMRVWRETFPTQPGQ